MRSEYRGPWTVLACALLLAVAGCTPERDEASLFAPGQVGVPVVDALLVVDRPLPEIRLSRTTRPDRPFRFEDAAIRGARVSVVVAGADTVDYFEWSPGFYLPLDGELPPVAPLTAYELAVVTDLGERVGATTRTPAAAQVVEWVLLERDGQTVVRRLRTFAELGDAVYEAPENQLIYTQGLLEGRLLTPEAPGSQVAIMSLDLEADFVIDAPFLDDEDLAELRRAGSSPALPLDTDTVRLPWFAIYWEGRHVMRVLLLDRNAFDLVRTSALGGGFRLGGNAGDGFERPIFHVDGGIGLFGSTAMDSIGFTVRPAEPGARSPDTSRGDS